MNLRVSFMYLNTARLMIMFVSSEKSAFPFTNKSEVATGIKFKESESRFLCSVYNLHSKKKCSASSKTAAQLYVGFDTIVLEIDRIILFANQNDLLSIFKTTLKFMAKIQCKGERYHPLARFCLCCLAQRKHGKGKPFCYF